MFIVAADLMPLGLTISIVTAFSKVTFNSELLDFILQALEDPLVPRWLSGVALDFILEALLTICLPLESRGYAL